MFEAAAENNRTCRLLDSLSGEKESLAGLTSRFYDAIAAAKDNSLLKEITMEYAKLRAAHIENYVSAYCAKTGLSPTEIEIVEEVNGFNTRWFCRPKANAGAGELRGISHFGR